MICEPACCSTRLTLENQFSGYVRTVKFLHCYSFGQFLLLCSQRASFPVKWQIYMWSFTLSFSFYCFYSWVLFTELENCITHVLLPFLVQNVQGSEISTMPAQCHRFDEVLLWLREGIFSTQLLLIFTSICLDMNRHFRGVLLSYFFSKFRADKVLLPQFIGLLTRRAFAIVHISRFCNFYQKRAVLYSLAC